MAELMTIHVTAHVFDDGMLGVKCPTDLRPGEYDCVLVVQKAQPAATEGRTSKDAFVSLARYLEETRADYIRKALASCDGNRTQAAKLLGVDVRTVFRALKDEVG